MSGVTSSDICWRLEVYEVPVSVKYFETICDHVIHAVYMCAYEKKLEQ